MPDPVVTLLHQRTEGWPAGLRLAALSLDGHPHPERFVAQLSGSDRTVGEYLMAELLDRQPPEVQRLLLRTLVPLPPHVHGVGISVLLAAVPPGPPARPR